MNRIDRLTAILIQLQSQRITKAQQIADRFEISLRTVYRDIRALEEAGVPIGSEAGIGYFLAEGYRLPPVMFTPEEARALLTARQFMTQLTDKGVHSAYESALFKLKSVMKADEQDMLNDLEDKVKVVAPAGGTGHPDEIHLALVQQALMLRKPLEMDYFSPASGAFTRRQVEPIGLVYYSDAWHMIAWCRLRQDYRDFRLDRMSKIKMLPQAYHLRDRLSLEQYLQRQSHISEARLVKVLFAADMARHTYHERYQLGFVQEEKREDGTEMWFMMACEDYFARWLLMFTAGAKVLEPESLKLRVQEHISELQQNYF
jgi:predicted DNA-binding transcriptional regulator YafY